MKSELTRALARARTGCDDDFLTIVRHYESLVFGFFRIQDPSCPSGAMNATQRLFFRLWDKVADLPRVSDFERELVAALVERDLETGTVPKDPRLAALAGLSARDRVIALAVEIGNWSVESAARAFGVSRAAMEHDLLRVRCDLIGVHFINLSEDEKRVLREVSTHLCRDLSKRQRKRMAEATCRSAELRDFKARCLEKRCEMVELWLDFRLSEEEQAWLLDGLLNLLQRTREENEKLGSPGFRWFLPRRRRKFSYS